MSDLVGNPEDWFSHNEAHLLSVSLDCIYHMSQKTCDEASGKMVAPLNTEKSTGSNCPATKTLRRRCNQMAGKILFSVSNSVKFLNFRMPENCCNLLFSNKEAKP